MGGFGGPRRPEVRAGRQIEGVGLPFCQLRLDLGSIHCFEIEDHGGADELFRDEFAGDGVLYRGLVRGHRDPVGGDDEAGRTIGRRSGERAEGCRDDAVFGLAGENVVAADEFRDEARRRAR